MAKNLAKVLVVSFTAALFAGCASGGGDAVGASNLRTDHSEVIVTIDSCEVSSTTTDGRRQRASVSVVNKSTNRVTPDVVVRWKDGSISSQKNFWSIEPKTGDTLETNGTNGWTMPSDKITTLPLGDQDCASIIESVKFTLKP